MPAWESVDEAGRVRRWEYAIGAARANAVAIEVGEAWVVISPPTDGVGRSALDRLGTVTAIVAPNGFHRAGIGAAEAHWPTATIHCDPRSRDRIAKVCREPDRVRPLTELAERLPADVEILVPPFLKRPDTIARVRTAGGVVWCFNDLVINIDRLPPGWSSRLLLRALGFRAELMVNPVGGRHLFPGDRKALAAWLAAELARLPATALVTGHGPVVRDPEALRGLPELVARGLA